MDVTRVHPEAESQLNIKNFVGWRIGWWTGWYNPFDRWGELVTNPVEIGRLVSIQGEFLVSQGRLVSELGNKLTELGKEVHRPG